MIIDVWSEKASVSLPTMYNVGQGYNTGSFPTA